MACKACKFPSMACSINPSIDADCREQAANFLIKMEEECLEVVKPKEARGSPASNEPGLAGKTAEFMPMRRKLRMPMDS